MERPVSALYYWSVTFNPLWLPNLAEGFAATGKIVLKMLCATSCVSERWTHAFPWCRRKRRIYSTLPPSSDPCTIPEGHSMGILTIIVGVIWILSLCNGECVIVYSAPLVCYALFMSNLLFFFCISLLWHSARYWSHIILGTIVVDNVACMDRTLVMRTNSTNNCMLIFFSSAILESILRFDSVKVHSFHCCSACTFEFEAVKCQVL